MKGFVNHLQINFRVWSPTLRSSVWERSRFLWMWWRWKVKTLQNEHIPSERKKKDWSLLVPIPEGIIAFAWEPNGSKFAVLHGESPRISSSFYHVKNNGKIELISKETKTWNLLNTSEKHLTQICTFPAEMFDKQQANSIFWSPQGQFLVLAGLRRSVKCQSVSLWGSQCIPVTFHPWPVFSFFHLIVTFLCSMNGALAFVDTSDCTMMNIAEHYMASDVEWDPTGRYVVTSVSWWSHKVEKLPVKTHLLFA